MKTDLDLFLIDPNTIAIVIDCYIKGMSELDISNYIALEHQIVRKILDTYTQYL